MNGCCVCPTIALSVGLPPFRRCCQRRPQSTSLPRRGAGVGISAVAAEGARAAATAPRGGRNNSDSPYQVLGVSPSASGAEIKRAYRRLALKYHPDVNKEPNAQENFMRIKHAYNTLMKSETRNKYANASSSYSGSTKKPKQEQKQEEFYGFTEFFKDLQEEFQNWEADYLAQQKPSSLWEELAEIGEEFVEFLEKELNINSNGEDGATDGPFERGTRPQQDEGRSSDKSTNSSIENSIDEIEAALARLKKELGL